MNVIERSGDTVAPIVPALTGVRCLAAMMVLIGHACPVLQFGDFTLATTILDPLAPIGMTIFFVLSGFVMWINYARVFEERRLDAALWQFGIARFARLYPLYFCILILAFATTPWDAVVAALPGSLAFIPVLQSWYPNNGSQILALSIFSLGHTWSISTEMFLYLSFPLFVFAMPRRFGAVAALATSLLYAVSVHWLDGALPKLARSVPSLTAQNYYTWIGYFSPLTRLFEFALGCCAGCCFLKGRKIGTIPNVIAATAAFIGLGITVTLYVTKALTHSQLIVMLRVLPMISAGLLVYCVTDPQNPIAKMLSSRVAVSGGNISYSLYLLHPFLLPMFTHAPVPHATLLGVLGWFGLVVIAITVTIIFSFGTYIIIEVPARRWLRRRLSPSAAMSLTPALAPA